MAGKRFKAIEHIKALNFLKKECFEIPSVSEAVFREGLKKCGIPSNPVFVSELKKSGMITEIEENIITWVDKKPVHYRTLQKVYNEYQKRMISYSTRYREKQREEKREEEEQVLKCINFLKSKGFEVFAPWGKLLRRT